MFYFIFFLLLKMTLLMPISELLVSGYYLNYFVCIIPMILLPGALGTQLPMLPQCARRYTHTHFLSDSHQLLVLFKLEKLEL